MTQDDIPGVQVASGGIRGRHLSPFGCTVETNVNKWQTIDCMVEETNVNPEPEQEHQLENYPNKSGKSELDFEQLTDPEKHHLESNEIDPELHIERFGDEEEECSRSNQAAK